MLWTGTPSLLRGGSIPVVDNFEGSFTVMVTPFTEGGDNVDVLALQRFVDWQISEGVPGLIPLGSTGEFLSITGNERVQIAETVIKQSAGRVPVLIGTADEWTDNAIAFSREAEGLGSDGVMVVPPYYSSPTDDELFVHYKRIAEAISIPVMVYNNPNTANVDLSPALIARMAEVDNILYIKESSGDISRVREITNLAGDKMTVFAGYHPWESIRLGAKGYVSVFGNILPRLSADLYALSSKDETALQARDLYHQVLPLMNAISGDLYVSATKTALRLIGMSTGDPRPPRLPLPDANVASLRQVLSKLNVLDDKAA